MRTCAFSMSLAAIVLVCTSCAGDDANSNAGGGAAAIGGSAGIAGSSIGGAAGVAGGAAGVMSTAGQGGTTGGAAGLGGAAGAMTGGAPGAGGTSGETDAGGGMGGADAIPPDAGPELGTVEHSGADCAIAELPSADALSAFETHHDPFVMLDGSRITKKAEWRCRRAEIIAQLEQYESGPKPVVALEDVSAELSGDTLSITVRAGDNSVDFSVNINHPAGTGAGPVPLSIAYNLATLDASVFAQNGVATLVYDNDAMGAESGAGSRGQGLFYDLYGSDHPASSMVAWAWGVSRIIDALELTPEANIDADRIAVTGCSRYGKGALLAGALDERIVLTIPQESGAGGSASWRVSQAQSQMGENVQTLSSAAGEQPWFRASFGQTFGGSNVVKLPFDHHMVMGIVAPRALLVLDNRIDWLGIDSTFTAGSIAHAVWEAFGVPDHMGYWQTGGHMHCQFQGAQRAILDAYVKKFLVGTGTDDTAMLRADNAEADLGQWMEWTPPTLE
jgi:hypothetical protein